MRISSLQFGLIVAGVLLVAGVLVYNYWVLRRARQRGGLALRDTDADITAPRVEPSFHVPRDGDDDAAAPAAAIPRQDDAANDLNTPDVSTALAGDDADATWQIPMDRVATLPPLPAMTRETADVARGMRRDATHSQPDPEIESVVALQPQVPVSVNALAPGLHARLGKPLRWFGRHDSSLAWQRLSPDAAGEFGEVVACLLLADRSGAASRSQLQGFVRLLSELAPTLPATFAAPPIDDEVARAEALDRLCAELDMQIGITIQKTDGTPIAGTKLRGVAEAAGFRLAPNGRFEWVQEENGSVIYTLQNMSGDPFTLDGLRAASLNGIVFVLDVPCVSEPARAFDQMKMAAGRLAHTVGGEMVDDNRRMLTDDALAKIRAQVVAAAAALADVHIEPGSPRALKLFSA